MSDEELHRRSAEGDADAFSRLFRRRSPSVYRFALRMGGDPALADEIVQEVFAALIRNPTGFDPTRGRLASYLYGTARNLLARRRADFRRESPLDEVDAPNELTPLDDMAQTERVETVRRAVLALPQPYREAVVLCDLEELSYEEAAQALVTAVGTVRSRLHRGRALLERKLALAPAVAPALPKEARR